ncbi:MAG: APC family permease, partial [Clostridia bacterium]|nr:APC family permease [Clostridia bacterium]
MDGFKKLKKILLGSALKDDQLSSEKLSRLWGLPIMASDAVSSVAYAVEEILMALVPALGILAVHYVGFVSVPIILLLLILVFSYSQIINHYPNGGGAYVVSKENFGKKSSLLAATCLIIDYIMTVAVSVSSSTAAILAVYPVLEPYRIIISLVCVGIITLINLRGIGESSKVFGIPTYAFIFSMIALIVTGFIRVFNHTLAPISYTPEQIASISQSTVTSMSLVLFLCAFSSGCSALTGVEAVSNAIPSFKEPSQKTAKQVLFMLGGIIIFIFGGTSFLATALKVVPVSDKTVLAQMATAIFGNGIMFYILQFTTSLILLLAANTSYSGLPILLSILAKDRYMPRQFAQRGTKLSFSNGIVFIFIVSSLLLIAFNADTHKLIPFYSVGVFVSFTISQFGMFVKWIRSKEPGWQYKSLINGFGALVTFIGSIVVFTTKFTHGAWALLIVTPILMWFMSQTHKHYFKFLKGISILGYNYQYKPSTSTDTFPCVVLINKMNRAALKTFDYANKITSNVTVLHISVSSTETERLKKQWQDLGIDVPLTVVYTPYRDIITPIEEFVSAKEAELKDDENLTVVLTRISGN